MKVFQLDTGAVSLVLDCPNAGERASGRTDMHLSLMYQLSAITIRLSDEQAGALVLELCAQGAITTRSYTSNRTNDAVSSHL